MISRNTCLIFCIVGLFCIALLKPNYSVSANEDEIDEPTVEKTFKGTTKGTDDDVIEREEEGIKLDGLSAAEFKELSKKAEKHDFDADVSRVMKLIINSIYRNKEIFLRELISNSADALNKIRVQSLTDPSVLSANEELAIYVKADKDNHVLYIIDTGIGMTKKDLETNLGTIAKSGTSDFVSRLSESTEQQKQDFIGQFGVGFYSSFLVADNVVVSTKHNDDVQYIWISDSNSFSIAEDPNGNTLKRGTQISLFLKEEAYDFLEPDTLKKLIQKYSQFVGHKIYLWQSKTETVEEPIDETKEKTTEDGAVEEEEKESAKTKSSTKTTWDYEHVNSAKPIWTRKPSEVSEEEYNDFYKSISKDTEDPLTHVHFSAEGEVTFKALLHVPKVLASNSFQEYGKTHDNIKLFVRRIFITDDFQDMLPKYLSFIRGVVDSDDLPLNVSRETLQQNKLLKVIKKKLVRKVLDMLKKISPEIFDKFWKEYSTNIKLGIMEDPSNRNRLAKLLRFYSSNDAKNQTSLSGYVERMKEKQDAIYYIAGSSRKEVENSPFLERLIKKGYEVIFLIEPVDEYCIQSLPEFDGKKFQNVAKEGLNLDENEKAKETLENLQKTYEPLLNWLKEKALVGMIEKAVVSQRLTNSPSALVAPAHGWSGNMERIMKSQAYAKSNDPTQDFYSSQKKTFEINPRHPIIKEFLRRIEQDTEDETALNNAKILYHTAVLRSGFSIQDQVGFAKSIESVVLKNLNLSADEQVDEEEEYDDETVSNENNGEATDTDSEKPVEVEEEHTEL